MRHIDKMMLTGGDIQTVIFKERTIRLMSIQPRPFTIVGAFGCTVRVFNCTNPNSKTVSRIPFRYWCYL